MRDKSECSIKNIPFIKGKIKNFEILLCLSGIGKVNSSISSVVAFQNFPVSKVIISGVAGAYPSSGLNVGDLVLAEKEINADEGLLINCDDRNESFIFINAEEIPLYLPDYLKDLKTGVFLTVSACTGNLNRAKFLERQFNALCENMEGFAIAKAAKLYNVPVTEIRSISNMVTDRTHLLKLKEVKKTAEIVQSFILDNISLFS
ncbi:MAG: hypothetical protein N2647_02760 [Thermodesulfovibrio sp.]|nr:hypothetical protein [Thermodesulfovibrio sp.]